MPNHHNLTEQFKKHSPTWCFWVIFIFIFFIFIVTAITSPLKLQEWWSYDGFFNHHMEKLNYVFIVLLTFGLILVAYVQLHGIKKSTEANFLLEIYRRYDSEGIREARKLIRTYQFKAKKENGESSEVSDHIADSIKEVAENEDKNEDYIHLISLLDFLETIAYYGNLGFIKPEQIKALLGGSIRRYYKLFSKFIDYRDMCARKYDEYELGDRGTLYPEFKKFYHKHFLAD